MLRSVSWILRSSRLTRTSTQRALFTINFRHYSTQSIVKKTTILDLLKKYKQKEPISMVTVYDYPSAIIAESAGIDTVLVGDSLGMVMLGYESTIPVTLEDMIHHCKAVSRGIHKTFVIGDLPFGTYEATTEDAVKSSLRLMKEGKVDAVKLEGGKRMRDKVEAIVKAGVPVIGHIGLTPQTLSALGGFRVQGKTAEDAERLLEDAKALESAGCFAIVIESVPEPVSEYITNALSIPTIGIGAGNKTSGQVLVWHDMLGLYPNFKPKFCKQYANLSEQIKSALLQFQSEVKNRMFPAKEHTYSMPQEEWDKFIAQKKCEFRNVSAILNSDSSEQKYVEENIFKKSKANGQSSDGAVIVDGEFTPSVIVSANNKINSTANAVDMLHSVEKSRLELDEGEYGKKSPPLVTFGTRCQNAKIFPKHSSRPKNICLIGGGAMGSLFAARLSLPFLSSVESSDKIHQTKEICINTTIDQTVTTPDATLSNNRTMAQNARDQVVSSHNVWVVSSWKEHIETINKYGLKIENLDNSEQIVKNIKATSRAEEVVDIVGPADLCIVLVKSPFTREAAKKARVVLGSGDGVVVTLQNGFGNREIIVSEVGNSQRVYQGVTNHAAEIKGPGHVKHTGKGLTSFALNAKSPYNSIVTDWASYFSECGFETNVTEEFESMIWGKLIVNAGINTLTALLQMSNGELYNSPKGRRLLEKLVRESVEVANAKKIQLPYKDPLDNVYAVLKATAINHSSMYYDVLRGVPTEIESINGVIVREGEKLGVPVTFNKTLLQLLSMPTDQIKKLQTIIAQILTEFETDENSKSATKLVNSSRAFEFINK
jgi:3-methyl-2-oxobutanoate hydroxymethyltransferase